MKSKRITRSDVNYIQHKKDIYDYLRVRKGEKIATRFIQYYGLRYDKFNRSFIDYKLAIKLFMDYHHVAKRNSMIWFGIVGSGGSGKTTIAKNIAYFLDGTFTEDRVRTKLYDIIKMFYNYLDGESKSFVMDEPDMSMNATSKRAMAVRDVFGKARQQKAFLIFCATDMTDIPNFIFKKLNRLIFTPSQGKGMYFADRPVKQLWFLGKLKKDYMDKISYSIFFKYKKYGLKFNATKYTPIDTENTIYLKKKKEDYKDSLGDAMKTLHTQKMKAEIDPRFTIIKQLLSKGLKKTEIAKLMEMSRPNVNHIIEKNEKVSATA